MVNRSILWLAIIASIFSTSTICPVYSEDYALLQASEIQCLIGNNAPKDEHQVGYNGLFRLTSIHQPKSIFVPSYAGLNLEHYFDGSSRGEDREVLFEPRRAPMTFRKTGEHSAELHQPPTPVWQVESTTVFRLSDPYYIDVTVHCIPRKDHFQGGALGLFWASYINSPLNKSVYFLRPNGDNQVWQQFCTQFHDHDSTIKHINDSFEWVFDPQAPTRLFTEISPIRFSEPFFYGRFENMVFIVMFEKPDGIRFSHSPSGGGLNEKKDDTCPAWDFQWIIPDPIVGKEYEMKYRAVHKKWAGREDVLNELNLYRR
ncbi:MAG: hypothetical protein JXR73_21660 [Candidatus Omnitrophica bacterium]|nr:hypothetical protein [Candidatus Omnitrophota bacterium]